MARICMSSLPDSAFRTRPTWVEIDLDAFEHNVTAIAASLPPSVKLIAVLKANGYGHGAVELARRCRPEKVAMIAVSLLEEALELRLAGIVLPILVLGPIGEEHIEAAFEHDITLGVPGPEELNVVVRAAGDREVSIHLKLDSGMGRMGVVETELLRVAELLRGSRVRLEAIYTHLANASDPADPFTDEQIARFQTLVETLREAGITAPRVHVANSAATVRGITPGDFVRVGIALYGAEALETAGEPPAGRPARPPAFRPVLRWRTEIARLKELPAGSAIGYGTTFRTSRPSRIATLPVGYADGYDRRFSNSGEVLVRGFRAPVVGRVSMDLVTIDVTDVPDAAVGDEVVLLGDGMRVEELAAKLDTIAYEVFCAISARVPRVYR
jgi:alanine racemase